MDKVKDKLVIALNNFKSNQLNKVWVYLAIMFERVACSQCNLISHSKITHNSQQCAMFTVQFYAFIE